MKKILSTILMFVSIIVLASCQLDMFTHVHNFSSDWKYDDNYHWHICECGEKETSIYHDFGTSYQKDAENHWQVCECGYETAKVAHAWDEGTVKTEPTDELAGLKTLTCTVCGEVKDVEIPAKGHALGELVEAVAPTCEKEGSIAYKACTTCDKLFDAEGNEVTTIVVPALGHTEEVVPGKAATCEEAGLTDGKKCSVCDKELLAQTEIPALGHTEVVDAAVAATCTEKGKTEGKHCSVCNTVLVAQEEVAALEHSYSTNYVWSADLLKVTATLVCANDSTHNLTEEVSTTYEVISASTTTINGIGKYTAIFENSNFETQTKEIKLDLIETKTYYFTPGVWAENDATFGVKVLNASGAEEIFKPLTKGDSGLYEFTCSVEMTHVCIYRFDSTGTEWWNGVENLEIPSNKDMFVITSWDSYLWDEYLTVDTASEFVEGDTLYLQLNGDWTSAMSASGFAVQFEGLNGSSDILAMEIVDSTNGIYKIVIPASGYIRVRFAQVNPSNVYEIWNVSDYTYCDHDSTTNLIKLQNGWNSMVGNWSVYSE